MCKENNDISYLSFLKNLKNSYRKDFNVLENRKNLSFFSRIMDRVNTNIGSDGCSRRMCIIETMEKQTTLYQCILKFREMDIDNSTKTHAQFVVCLLSTLALLARKVSPRRKGLPKGLNIYSNSSLQGSAEPILARHYFDSYITNFSSQYNFVAEGLWYDILDLHIKSRNNESAFLAKAVKLMNLPLKETHQYALAPY